MVMCDKKFTWRQPLYGIFAITAGSLLSGCWFLGEIDDQEVTDMDKELHLSEKNTAYDKSLREFGQMLEAYNVVQTRLQSKLISNQTAERSLPENVSRMLISAVNKIGNKVMYVPYDPTYVLSEAQTGGDIKRALPQIVLVGGITEFDKDMIEKNRRLRSEVSLQEGDFGSKYSQDGGAGYTAEGSISRMALDLQLMDYRTQAYFANVQSINQINIRKTKLGWSIGYYFQGSGAAFEYEIGKKQGIYYALRLLVELSVLETLGKYFDVPYWRCVEKAKPNAAMIARIREEFENLPESRQLSFLREYLFFHGYPNIASPDGAVTPPVLSAAMKKWNCSTNVELFMRLWETVPIQEARLRNTEYKRNTARREQLQYQENVNRYNQLISRGDELYNAGRLQDARSLYIQARRIFPEQEDPLLLIARIDRELQAKETAKNNQTSPPQPTVRTATTTAPQPTPQSEPDKKSNKETPLNPFMKVSW